MPSLAHIPPCRITRNLADARREAAASAIDRLRTALEGSLGATFEARADLSERDSNTLTSIEVLLQGARDAVENLGREP